MRIVLVGAARPNFIKVAPVLEALEARGVEVVLVHAGQHYDDNLSGQILRGLGMRSPDVQLETGSGTHAQQTASVMTAFEPVVQRLTPDAVVVVGDVNSTLACTLVAAKLLVPVAHVEAGLRSHDRTMPEEINRVCTDVLSDWLLTPSADADANLVAEGCVEDRIFRVGNVMVDTLLRFCEQARASATLAALGIDRRAYALVTLHRPSAVDDESALRSICQALAAIAAREPVVFPVHPRTTERLDHHGLRSSLDAAGVLMLPPQDYLSFVALMDGARVVLTDSGGIQEETTVLGVPCLTLRRSTERPITVSEGTNRVVGTDPAAILAAYEAVKVDQPVGRPELWDGKAAGRVADVLMGTPPPLASLRAVAPAR